ncbi:MAG: hypothetical protein EOP06_23225, partial [Proteobacteria bacterium]
VALFEVGHALGLRHNFAGSASVSISAVQIVQRLKEYLVDAKDPGAMTSSTVMDYIKGADEALLGRFIKGQALPYDQMAMKWAYADHDRDLDVRTSRYCSDEDISLALLRNKVEIYDCRRHDSAGSQFVTIIDDHLRVRKTLLMEKYKSIVEVLFPADEPNFVNSLPRLLEDNHPELGLQKLTAQMSYYRKKDNIISLEKWRNEIQRNFTTQKDPSLDRILQKDLDEVGGLTKVKALVYPNTADWTAADLNAVLQAIDEGNGVTPSGRTYQLTAQHKQLFADYIKGEAAYVQAQLEKQLNEVFRGL